MSAIARVASVIWSGANTAFSLDHPDPRESRGVEHSHRRVRRRIASPGMLLKKFPPMIGSAPPNRLGGAHGGNYQHGRAARGSVGGSGALLVGRAGREGMHP